MRNMRLSEHFREETAYEGVGPFVLFREEMGGRQSSRLIASDGKCFPLSHHNN